MVFTLANRGTDNRGMAFESNAPPTGQSGDGGSNGGGGVPTGLPLQMPTA